MKNDLSQFKHVLSWLIYYYSISPAKNFYACRGTWKTSQTGMGKCGRVVAGGIHHLMPLTSLWQLQRSKASGPSRLRIRTSSISQCRCPQWDLAAPQTGDLARAPHRMQWQLSVQKLWCCQVGRPRQSQVLECQRELLMTVIHLIVLASVVPLMVGQSEIVWILTHRGCCSINYSHSSVTWKPFFTTYVDLCIHLFL